MTRGYLNGSFVAWLMEATMINPLPAHTRCPKCGNVRFYPEINDGWDMKAEKCHCGAPLLRDGHNIPFEAVFAKKKRLVLSLECNVPAKFEKEIWQLILEKTSHYFSAEKYVCKGLLENEQVTRLFFSPRKDREQKISMDDLPVISEERYWNSLSSVPSILLFSSSDLNLENLAGADVKLPALDELLHEDVISLSFQKVLNELGNSSALQSLPVSFSSLVSFSAALHNSYAADSFEHLLDILDLPKDEQLPLTKEDVWHFVQEKVQSDDIKSVITTVCEKAAKGSYSRSFSQRDEALFDQLGLPEWFKRYVQHVRYLFPRCHCISYAYIDLIHAMRTTNQ